MLTKGKLSCLSHRPGDWEKGEGPASFSNSLPDVLRTLSPLQSLYTAGVAELKSPAFARPEVFLSPLASTVIHLSVAPRNGSSIACNVYQKQMLTAPIKYTHRNIQTKNLTMIIGTATWPSPDRKLQGPYIHPFSGSSHV